MRSSDGWDRLRRESESLGVSLSQACRRVGIRRAVFRHYLSGSVVPDSRTISKLESFFRGVRERRKIFYAIP